MAFVELLTFSQRERGELNFVSGTTIQTSVVVNEVIKHPRVSATADNEHDVLAMTSPSVPEGL